MAIRRPATFRYLQYAVTLEEAKKTYKEYAVQLHPDKGGRLEDMQQLNMEWDYIKKVPVLPISRRVDSYTTPRPQPRPTPPPPPPSNPKPKQPRPESRNEKQENVNRGFSKFYQEHTSRQNDSFSSNNVDSNTFDWDEFVFIIDGLFDDAVKRKKRAASVYYSFYDTLQQEGKDVTKKQLEYIATKLGYQKGWVFFQREILEGRNIKIV